MQVSPLNATKEKGRSNSINTNYSSNERVRVQVFWYKIPLFCVINAKIKLVDRHKLSQEQQIMDYWLRNTA
jgi:hypothetical protein